MLIDRAIEPNPGQPPGGPATKRYSRTGCAGNPDPTLERGKKLGMPKNRDVPLFRTEADAVLTERQAALRWAVVSEDAPGAVIRPRWGTAEGRYEIEDQKA